RGGAISGVALRSRRIRPGHVRLCTLPRRLRLRPRAACFSPLPKNRYPAGARRSGFRTPGPAILPHVAGATRALPPEERGGAISGAALRSRRIRLGHVRPCTLPRRLRLRPCAACFSPLPESRYPAGNRRSEFRGSGPAILPHAAGATRALPPHVITMQVGMERGGAIGGAARHFCVARRIRLGHVRLCTLPRRFRLRPRATCFSPLPQSRCPAGARRSEFRTPGPAILPQVAGATRALPP